MIQTSTSGLDRPKRRGRQIISSCLLAMESRSVLGLRAHLPVDWSGWCENDRPQGRRNGDPTAQPVRLVKPAPGPILARIGRQSSPSKVAGAGIAFAQRYPADAWNWGSGRTGRAFGGPSRPGGQDRGFEAPARGWVPDGDCSGGTFSLSPRPSSDARQEHGSCNRRWRLGAVECR